MMIWMAACLLFILAALAAFMAARQSSTLAARNRFDQAWGGDEPADFRAADSRMLWYRIHQRLERMPGTGQAETQRDLRRAGWNSDAARSLFLGAAWLLPPLAGLLSGIDAWSGGKAPFDVLTAGFIGFTLGYLAPRKFLRWRAKKRQKRIGNEMPVVLHLLRMLFDAGLSLEHALRVTAEEGGVLAPTIAIEFGQTLLRINAGQERGDALDEMALSLDVAELTDTVAILKQVARYGGSLNDTLFAYVRLLEDRRITTMRETVGKLSAKMTVVMVLFMFPALMVFLAGPGFIGLIKALGNAHG
ncbi:MAG: type II secretion system F family protein [Betaproteobacteria bacterium]|nr:type II secretion system F family protein [Betaproteobacteria bacterium]